MQAFLGVRSFIFVVIFAALAVVGCPGCPRSGEVAECIGGDTRCSPTTGMPEVCRTSGNPDETPPRGKWFPADPLAESCNQGTSCCYAGDPYGGFTHACVPPVACLPEPDAGDASADASDDASDAR